MGMPLALQSIHTFIERFCRFACCGKPGASEVRMRPLVFLVDVDNTLVDNDRIEADLRDHLERCFGLEACERYWSIFEELRQEVGYADFLGALQRYRLERLHDPRLLRMSSFMVDYPFADRLYPKALEVIANLDSMGDVVIL